MIAGERVMDEPDVRLRRLAELGGEGEIQVDISTGAPVGSF
jgi:hypothetical protein